MSTREAVVSTVLDKFRVGEKVTYRFDPRFAPPRRITYDVAKPRRAAHQAPVRS